MTKEIVPNHAQLQVLRFAAKQKGHVSAGKGNLVDGVNHTVSATAMKACSRRGWLKVEENPWGVQGWLTAKGKEMVKRSSPTYVAIYNEDPEPIRVIPKRTSPQPVEMKVSYVGAAVVNIRPGPKERSGVLYADIIDANGRTVMSATLDACVERLKERLIRVKCDHGSLCPGHAPEDRPCCHGKMCGHLAVAI